MSPASTIDPHAEARVLHHGAPLERAQAAVILLHGRGASAAGILRLAPDLMADADVGDRVAFLAPQAVGNTWYPQRFIAPLDQNEPWLSSALGVIDRLIDEAAAHGLPPQALMVAGFSQGACLALEHAARGSRPVGTVAGLSGALIGPPDKPRRPLVDVAGLRVFLGTGTVDDHVAPEQVERAAQLFREAGATVDLRIYEGMPHTINEDEIAALRELVRTLPGA